MHTVREDRRTAGRAETAAAGGRAATGAATAERREAAGRGRTARVAIAGATGYTGQELVRLLARHPLVTLTQATSSGTTPARSLPALARLWDGAITPLDRDTLGADAEL